LPSPAEPTAPEGAPLASMVPAIVTSPLARIYTGVLAELRWNVTFTPAGMFTVVKLNIPSAGNVRTVSLVGLNAPSAPVLPLLNAHATEGALTASAKAIARYNCSDLILM
jgi:hypothetical protein